MGYPKVAEVMILSIIRLGRNRVKTLAIRALSAIKRSAAPRVLHLIKRSCSCFK